MNATPSVRPIAESTLPKLLMRFPPLGLCDDRHNPHHFLSLRSTACDRGSLIRAPQHAAAVGSMGQHCAPNSGYLTEAGLPRNAQGRNSWSGKFPDSGTLITRNACSMPLWQSLHAAVISP